MSVNRRNLLAASVALVGTAGLSGCSGGNDRVRAEQSGEASDTGSRDSTPQPGNAEAAETSKPDREATVDAAVAAEWNAMRARVWDALALGVAGDTGAGSRVAQNVFARFEQASGEFGAHEMLEHTSESNYEEFEEALSELRSAGLDAGNLERAREEAAIADTQLAEAQRSILDERTANALDLQLLGAVSRNVAVLAHAGSLDGATTVVENVQRRFEESPAHDALESADSDAYESFESGLEAAATAASNGNAKEVRRHADAASGAAIDGSYAVADLEAAAGAGHVATFQARGWDAAALASMGGPSTDFAHAAALTVYRARVHDAQWLAARGQTDRAATMAGDVFAHFEGARAHEALEEADHEAYEGFEAGLSNLKSAIENDDSEGIDEALGAVDSNLVTGIGALAGSNASLLEAAFFKARLADAREEYRLGGDETATAIARSLFERFEANELDLHESVEEASEEIYHDFEENHLTGIVDAFENGNDDSVRSHYDGALSALLEYETTAGSTPTVSGAEAAFMAARGFDAAVLGSLGKNARAKSIAQGAFQHFESGAGGYHEALEEADEAIYESFEEALGALSSATENGEDVYGPVTTFNQEAVDSAYAIVENAGGSHGEAAATVMQNTFATFEKARVHELLEHADHNAYETFEATLDAYLSALNDGGDVQGAAGTFADGAQYAQFALVDAVEKLPLDLDLASGDSGGNGKEHGHGSGGESGLQGGPNVVEGVPDDADHVVDMNAVAFAPTELTVSKGDTVAWKHAAGEPHSVTALEESIPEEATYWASGGFDSEESARTGWEEGKGAVSSGHAYVHTFETAGTYEYVCIPHEAAGMTGTVTVE